MRTRYQLAIADQNAIQCQIRHGDEKLVHRKFGPVAKILWPIKPAAHLAVIGGVSERTACRWLSGEFEPPASVIAATILEMTKLQ
jgi:hypothetical protein